MNIFWIYNEYIFYVYIYKFYYKFVYLMIHKTKKTKQNKTKIKNQNWLTIWFTFWQLCEKMVHIIFTKIIKPKLDSKYLGGKFVIHVFSCFQGVYKILNLMFWFINYGEPSQHFFEIKLLTHGIALTICISRVFSKSITFWFKSCQKPNNNSSICMSSYCRDMTEVPIKLITIKC